MMTLQWQANICSGPDVRFRFITDGYGEAVTTDEEVILLKGPWHFGLYSKLFEPSSVKSIMEFGIFEGGSAILFAHMFPNAKIVGIDMRKPNPAVLRHIDRLGLGDRISLHYGILQDDREAVSKIIAKEFSEPIELIVDDCSHRYDLTRKSFEIAFPSLKCGGSYAIEDWDWAHSRSNQYASWSSPVLANMVYELTAALHSAPTVITEAQIFRGLAVFRKGAAGGAVELANLVHTDRLWSKF